MDKIDFVITWVDGNDEAWQKDKAYWSAREKGEDVDNMFEMWNANAIRYRDLETLRYWFRGVEKFAPWVNKVHFVTYGHLPSWLNTSNPKLNIVNHKDFIPKEYLPTFNSHTIEWNMHRINGLSEQFVYFNDDVFLIKPVKESLFFKKGLPCETCALDCIAMEWNVGHAEIKNTQLLNKHFVKRNVMRQNFTKWFNLKYGKQLIKTMALLPWDQFTGMYEGHITLPFLKSSFEKVWEIEPDPIDATCKTKFRTDNNVSLWFVKNWQLAKGEFIPRKAGIGKVFLNVGDKKAYDFIAKQKKYIVCVNDEVCTEEEFELHKKNLKNAFEKILPEKSTFEI